MKRIIVRLLKIALAVVLVLVLAGYFLLRTDRGVDGLNRHDTEHFVIYYQQLKPSTLDDMEQALESGFQRSDAFFDVYRNKTEIIIFESVDAFQVKAYGLAYSWYLKDWSVGGASEDKIFMASPENPDKSHSYESMLEILTHEYVHTQVWQLNPDLDTWIGEGLAVYFAEQKREIDREIPSFEIMQSQDPNAFGDAGGYLFGYYYIEHLFENYQPEQILELIKTGEFESSLGKSKREIYDEWVLALSAKSTQAN